MPEGGLRRGPITDSCLCFTDTEETSFRCSLARVRLQFYTNIMPTLLSWKQGAWVRQWSWAWWGSQRQVWELKERRENMLRNL